MAWNGIDSMRRKFMEILEDKGSESDVDSDPEIHDEEVDLEEEEIGVDPSILNEVEVIYAGQDNQMVVKEEEQIEEYDEYEDDELARHDMMRAIKPLSSPVRDRSPVRFRIEELPIKSESTHNRDLIPSRRGTARGRRATRGRRRGGATAGPGRAQWVRGDPLVEMFVSDEDLPENLRDSISQYLANRRNRVVGNRQRQNNELVDSEDRFPDEDEFFDAEGFTWGPITPGAREIFVPEVIGPTQQFTSPYDAFRAYWDDEILSHIVQETNIYAQGVQSAKFQRLWYETNVDEILLFFAFWMMLGIIKMPTINSCFSRLPIMKTEVFRFMFSESRYWNINRSIHFARGSRDINKPDNVLYPVEHIINHLNHKFKDLYKLNQEICIDESLTLWKGPLGFKQYIKTKAARFGIKTQQLCESSTGYLWSFFVYIGKRTTTSSLQSSVWTVLKLVQPLLNLGHTLYMDNWYNSPLLARYLKRRRTDCVGTLRANRLLHVPPVIQKASLSEGQFVARQSGDVRLISLQDRKRVQFVSTYHDVTQVQTAVKPGRQSQYKLQLNVDYNHGMGGVNRMDQMLEPYLIERKQCVKWTRKLFKRLLNITIQNSRILVEKSNGKPIDSLLFRLMLVQAIIDKHHQNVPRPHNIPLAESLDRYSGMHFIEKIPITEEEKRNVAHKSNWGRKRCKLCLMNKVPEKKTKFRCEQCKVPLCTDSCFKAYHIK